MSLNWDLSKVVDHGTKCWDTYTGTQEEMEKLVNIVTFVGPDWGWADPSKSSIKRMNLTTQTLIWASMSVGLSEITLKNHEEWFRRVNMLETSDGAYRLAQHSGWKTGVMVTPEEVQEHIGLRVNVTDMTKTKWERWFFKRGRK